MTTTTDPTEALSESEIEQAELDDWRVLFITLHARFRTGDFETGLKLVKKIGKAADKADHHPDVDLSYPLVDVRLSSHDAGGVTSRDIDLARQISGFAADLDAEAAPGELSVIELALDTPTYDDVKPFWAAVLGYTGSKEHAEELNDPDGTRTTLWFQKADSAKGEVQQRFHLDVRVPPEVAEDRVKRRARRRRHAGQRRARADGVGARRRARQQGLRHHLAGPRPRPRLQRGRRGRQDHRRRRRQQTSEPRAATTLGATPDRLGSWTSESAS